MEKLLALSLPSDGGTMHIPDPLSPTAAHRPVSRVGGLFNSSQSIGEMIGALIPYVFAFAGIILFVMFIMAGFTLLTATGNKEKIAKGSAMMTSSIIGFVVIFIAFWIMQLLEMVLGVNLGFKGLTL